MHHRTFGSYQVSRPLGAGGLGVTYLVQRSSALGFERQSVIKSFPGEWLGGQEVLEGILMDIQTALPFNHPNIVSVEEFDREQGEYYLAMEYVQGVSLATLLSTGTRLPSDVSLLAVMQALQAVDYAHYFYDSSGTSPIVHGDLCPANVLLSFHGNVKVTDFGLLGLREQLHPHYPGSITQRWRYRAPELREHGYMNVQADVYSLGVILYEALSGTRVNNASRSPEQMHQEIAPLRDVLPDVSPQLETIVHRAIAADPNARYASAQAFLEDLEGFVAPVTRRQLQWVLREFLAHFTAPGRSSWSESAQPPPALVRCTTAERPLIYILSQDSVFSEELCNQIADPWGIGGRYQVQFLRDKAEVDWAHNALARREQIPHAVLFGGLHVALSHPFLHDLQEHAEVSRILLLEHPNLEVLQIGIHLCGLDAFIPGPVDLQYLSDTLHRTESRVGMRRRLFELQDSLRQIRRAEADGQIHLEALRQVNEVGNETIEELKHKNLALREKNRFLQMVSRAALQPKHDTPEPSSVFLQGQLQEMHLVDLCQLMRMIRKTAVISLTYLQETGSIYFVDGTLTHAVSGPLKERLAVRHMLRWEEGTFEVHSTDHGVEQTIFEATEQLLLNILREQDEGAAASLEISIPEGDWF